MTIPGFKDCANPQRIAIFKRIQTTVAAEYELAGFDEMRTPAIEFTGSIGNAMADGIFAVGDGSLCLRYDHTAPLARYITDHMKSLQFPWKPWRQGWVWRNELNIRAGRFREFYQMDADIVGTSNFNADTSLIRLLLRIFRNLGLDVTLKFSSRILADQLFDELAIADSAVRKQVMREIDKLSRLKFEVVEAELQKLVDASQLNGILEFLNTKHPKFADKYFRLACGPDSHKAVFDPGLMRGMDYYTGLVFEVCVDGYEHYGSVAGGGRYDELAGTPCTGVSVGVSRLTEILAETTAIVPKTAPVVVCTMKDTSNNEVGFVEKLHNAGIRSEIWQGNSRKLGRMLAYADRINSPAAVIQGPDEFKNNTVQIKNLALGRKMAKNIADNAEWRAKNPGQIEVPADQLVATVRNILQGDEQ